MNLNKFVLMCSTVLLLNINGLVCLFLTELVESTKSFNTVYTRQT